MQSLHEWAKPYMGRHTHKAEHSLARRLVRTVLAIYLGIALSLTFVQLSLEYYNEKNRLIEEVGLVAKTFKPILMQALWNLDQDQIDIALQAILGTNSDLLSVKVLNKQGEVDFHASKSRLKNDNGVHLEKVLDYSFFHSTNDSLSDSYLFEFNLIFTDKYTGDQNLGVLVLTTQSSVVFRRVAPNFYITLISALIKTMILASIFFFVLNRLVGKPMNVLSNAMRSLDPNQRGKGIVDDIDPALLKSKDEIGVALKTFQTMKQAIEEKDASIYEYQAHLEEKISERTKQVEEVFKAKSDFLANMSHEIRTPMNGVLGIARLLSETKLDEKQERFLEIIENSGETLLKTINAILDHLKIEAGKLELDYKPFCIKTVVDNCAGLFEYQARSSSIELTSAIDANCPNFAFGDSTRIQQVLTNLFSNAFKFTTSGGISITVSKLQDIDEKTVELRFLVRDTGIGVNQEKITELFMPFSQADSSTTRNYGGTGLGLSISKQLTELMGGGIYASGEEGKGSSFWIDLPLRIDVTQNISEDSVHSPQDVLVPGSKGVNSNDFTGLKVLVAEDNAVNQIVIDGILRKLGITATIVDNGQKAVEACFASKEHFDLILMDCEMPVMDGWQATKTIRSSDYTEPGGKPVLIYALSAHTKDKFLDEASCSGMDGYLFKPIVVDQLIAIFDSIISKSG